MKGIIKDAMLLFVITLISGMLLGLVYDVTKEPIANQKAKAKAEACAQVFADAVNFEQVVPEASLNESMNAAKATVSEIMHALDASGNVLGYVITVTSHEGYGGDITFLVGIRNDGTINGISITEIGETAGLGMKAKEDAFLGQFSGKKVDEFVYTKSGAKTDNEIDAISAATVTTNAMTNGVNAALEAFRAIFAYENGGAR